ncbi:MAG: SH3 domain-containing protein [Clostridia bacterium]|nr:SH3 domain-containing protein [Clostridia bacterium]
MKKSAFFWVVMLCIMLTAAYAETAYVDGKTASRVHLRNAPSKQADSIGLFYTGTEVKLDDSTLADDWARVQIGAVNGYIMCDYLSHERPLEYMLPGARVKSDTLNLRSGPSKNNDVEAVLKEQEQLCMLGQCSNDWYYVKTQNGLTGYVMPEYVTLTGEMVSDHNADIRKIGECYNGDFIYSWPAPNGQTLYFTALEDPVIQYEDVNFDGHKDVVVFIIRGASNFFTEFFVWDDGQYVYARHPGLTQGICNYHLYPEYGIVHSDANNGSAGAEHEDVLLRWEGNELRVIRRALSENATEMTRFSDGGGYTIHTDLQNLRVRVWDYTKGIAEGELIYETFISHQALDSAETYSRLFAGEQEALWRDIK